MQGRKEEQFKKEKKTIKRDKVGEETLGKKEGSTRKKTIKRDKEGEETLGKKEGRTRKNDKGR